MILDISREQLILAFADKIPPSARNIRFTVEIPGGGDWSNDELEIGDESAPVIKLSFDE